MPPMQIINGSLGFMVLPSEIPPCFIIIRERMTLSNPISDRLAFDLWQGGRSTDRCQSIFRGGGHNEGEVYAWGIGAEFHLPSQHQSNDFSKLVLEIYALCRTQSINFSFLGILCM